MTATVMMSVIWGDDSGLESRITIRVETEQEGTDFDGDSKVLA